MSSSEQAPRADPTQRGPAADGSEAVEVGAVEVGTVGLVTDVKPGATNPTGADQGRVAAGRGGHVEGGPAGDSREDFRMTVMRRALDLFSAHGYEATTVDQIAEVSGISRRTFFRQFRAKEDVVFVDHDHALDQVTEYLSHEHPDPVDAVCRAAEIVYRRFQQLGPLAEQRYQVVRQVPTLRDREILMTTRYERVFHSYLRRTLPRDRHLDAVQLAAAVTATHNWFLRRLMRGEPTGLDALRGALVELSERFVDRPGRAGSGRAGSGRANLATGGTATHDVAPTDAHPPAEAMVVAVFPAAGEPQRIAEAIDRALRGLHGETRGHEDGRGGRQERHESRDDDEPHARWSPSAE